MEQRNLIPTRRTFLKVSSIAGLGAVSGGALLTIACGKNISVYTQTVIGTLEELLPLLPNLSDSLKKAISIAKTFDQAYRDGKFMDAATLFTNLSTLASQIFQQAGGSNQAVNVALTVGGVALRAIATLLVAQATRPRVAAVVATRASDPARAMIEHMADPVVMNQVLNVVKP